MADRVVAYGIASWDQRGRKERPSRTVIPATDRGHPDCISSLSLASQEPQPSAGWLSPIRT
jgi:hypothetical protein